MQNNNITVRKTAEQAYLEINQGICSAELPKGAPFRGVHLGIIENNDYFLSDVLKRFKQKGTQQALIV